MADWMLPCGAACDTTDVATDVEFTATDEVRAFVAAHGGRVFVWVAVHPAMWRPILLLETSLEPPRKKDLSFRRVKGPGFDVYLEGTRRTWPRVMEFALRRHKRVEAYWNGLAWVA